jgi:hypothetical protein
MKGHSYNFPFGITGKQRNSNVDNQSEDILSESMEQAVVRPNLSKRATTYLAAFGIRIEGMIVDTAALIWMHALAIGYSPAYLHENADGIRQDWPRIPLPAEKKRLLRSAELGERVAALLDTENPVDGVTSGKIAPLLREIGVIRKDGGGNLNPDAGELDLTTGWGHAGKAGVCMPGKGRIEPHEVKSKKQRQRLGPASLDVFLNDVAYWSNIPESVWEYYIGGYQVIKKWLSYREKKVLGRGLKLEEAEYIGEMARRLSALILMQDELDENYQAVKADTWEWPQEQ